MSVTPPLISQACAESDKLEFDSNLNLAGRYQLNPPI